MRDPIEPFLGTWTLDPESSKYEQGDPPIQGSYRIEDEFGLLKFQMDWIDSNGEKFSESFSGIPDGPATQLRESGLVDSMTLKFDDSNCLVSEALREEVTIMKASRELSKDEKTLTIIQTVNFSQGQSFVNRTVYRKSD